MNRIIAVFHQAGGVGKSTGVQNLGYQLSQRGHRVLLVDMDPQGSLSTFMGLDPVALDKKQTIYEAVVREASLPIHRDIYSMDLVPANLDFCAAEMELVMADLRDFRLQYALEPVKDDYEFILLDCPPSLGILTYLSLVAATHVLVPVETQFKAFQSLELLLHTVKRVQARPNRNLGIAGFVPTKYDSRNSLDKEILLAMQEQLPSWGKVYSPIVRSTALADATRARKPLALYEPKHPAVTAFNQLAQGIESL
jgi:chromosome partitioning protein